MRLNKHKPLRSLAFNMTPMIDIVFLLIIFFMTVSQITRTVDVPLPLPRVNSGSSDAETASLTLNLDAEGTIMIGGRTGSLLNALAHIQRQLLKFDNDPNRIKIQIRCDRSCECRHVSTLLKSLSEMGFTHVRSSVIDSSQSP